MASEASERLDAAHDGNCPSRRTPDRQPSEGRRGEPRNGRAGARRARLRVHGERLRAFGASAALRLPAHAGLGPVPAAGRPSRVCELPDDRAARSDADRRARLTAVVRSAVGTRVSSVSTSGSPPSERAAFGRGQLLGPAGLFELSLALLLDVPLARQLCHRLLSLGRHSPTLADRAKGECPRNRSVPRQPCSGPLLVHLRRGSFFAVLFLMNPISTMITGTSAQLNLVKVDFAPRAR